MNFKGFKIVRICLTIKIKFSARKFCIKISFCNYYFSPLNTSMRKVKDPDPYLCNGSRCGYGIPKNIQILRIRNTADNKSEKCIFEKQSYGSDLLFGAPGTVDFPVTVVTLRAAVPAY